MTIDYLNNAVDSEYNYNYEEEIFDEQTTESISEFPVYGAVGKIYFNRNRGITRSTSAQSWKGDMFDASLNCIFSLILSLAGKQIYARYNPAMHF